MRRKGRGEERRVKGIRGGNKVVEGFRVTSRGGKEVKEKRERGRGGNKGERQEGKGEREVEKREKRVRG